MINRICEKTLMYAYQQQKRLHLSKDNNSPAQAMLTIRNILEENGYYLGKNLSMEVAQREGIGRLLTI